MAVKRIFVNDDYEDWDESDWDDYIEAKAEKLADQRIKQNIKYGANPKEGDRDRYVSGFKEKMLRAYPFDKFDANVYAAFENMGDEDGVKWLSGWKDRDPMKGLERAKFSKHLPLLRGIAGDGEDWYSMGAQKLRDIGGEMGYKTGTKEGFKEFLETLSGYQQQLDRANLVKEMNEIPGSSVSKVVYPTLTKAIEEAVATGKDLPKDKAMALGLMDAGINAGQFMAPSLNVLKSRPVINAALDAGIQGGLEAGRQAAGSGIADVEPDYVQAPVTSLTAGLTRPAMFGTTQGLLGGFTGPNWMSFRRGMMGSTRVGNPVLAERAALEKSIDDFNGKVARYVLRSGDGITTFMNLADKNVALRANLPARLSEELGIARTPASGGGKSVFLDKQAILDAYDRLNPQVAVKMKDGVTSVVDELTAGARTVDILDDTNLIGGKQEQTLRSLIPSKFTDLEDRNRWYNAGMGVGTFVNDLGGRMEPTFKLNVLNPFHDSPLKDDKDAYKKTSWYRALPVKSRKIFDEAMKEKQEEEEE